MIEIPLTPALKNVARRLIWFKEPNKALQDPYTFLAHVMTYGTVEDVLVVKRTLGLAAFQEALEHMPPGIMDPKSWSYGHLITGKYPAPPMPARKIH